MNSKKINPPIPVEVKDLKNFARLALALVETPQILWSMLHEDRHILALFTAYTYWKGDVPLLVYVNEDNRGKPYLAYKSNSLDNEVYSFEESADDPRYRYGSFIEVKEIPKIFQESLNGNFEPLQKPLLVEINDMASLIRIPLTLSMREESAFPIWHFKRNNVHIISVFVPFERYYEADAIPIFFYLKQDHPPTSPFVRYSTSKSFGVKVEYADDTSDNKFFYSKIINVKDFPIFP